MSTNVRQEATPRDRDGPTPSASYSVEAEQRRRRGRHRKKSSGRRPTARKFAQAQSFEDIYPGNVPRADCQVLRERAVWRLVDNRAVLIGYRLFGRPGGPEPPIPGVTPRCEYGIEILVVLAFLTYVIGLSLAKACAVLLFFCRLPLSRAQADALLRQLANSTVSVPRGRVVVRPCETRGFSVCHSAQLGTARKPLSRKNLWKRSPRSGYSRSRLMNRLAGR